MIEFVSEATKNNQSFFDLTTGSKEEVKRRMRRKGGAWRIFAGMLANLTATGNLKKYNKKITKIQNDLEHKTIDLNISLNELKEYLELNRDNSILKKQSKVIKSENTELKLYIQQMVKAIHEYKRIYDDDKESGILRRSVKELDRYDFIEIYSQLDLLRNSTKRIDEIVTAIATNSLDFAMVLIVNMNKRDMLRTTNF